MKDTTSNMVAPLNPLEFTAAQIVRICIQTHDLEKNLYPDSRLGKWSTELEHRHKQEVPNTKYFMPNYHIVSIAP